MDDLGVVLASLVMGQLIITAVLLSAMAAARAWTGPPSGANARTALAHVLRRIRSGLRHSQSGEPADPTRSATPISPSGGTSGASTPQFVVFPVLSLIGLPASRSVSDVNEFEVGASRIWPEPLVRTPPLVALPVTSLAGLPISRPVLEGWLGRRKRSKGAARRRAVRKFVSGECSECRENRAQGRNYCVDCRRRLTPFLPANTILVGRQESST
jgi:hypothetical protein